MKRYPSCLISWNPQRPGHGAGECWQAGLDEAGGTIQGSLFMRFSHRFASSGPTGATALASPDPVTATLSLPEDPVSFGQALPLGAVLSRAKDGVELPMLPATSFRSQQSCASRARRRGALRGSGTHLSGRHALFALVGTAVEDDLDAPELAGNRLEPSPGRGTASTPLSELAMSRNALPHRSEVRQLGRPAAVLLE